MFGKYDDDIERDLQNTGYVPAGVDCLWIGDEFMWDRPSFEDRDNPQHLRVVGLEAIGADYAEEDGSYTPHLIIRIVAWDDEVDLYRHMSIGRGHTTWVRQCAKNRRELFDLHAEYEAAKDVNAYA